MRQSPALCAATIAAALLLPCQAAAAPPPPTGLEPQEGSGWQAESRFGVHWHNPEPVGSPIAAVHYLVRDPLGAVVLGPRRLDLAVERVEGLRLIGGIGAYTAVVWLEDAAGVEGAPATTALRFDDSRPGPSTPAAESGWIGRAELPHAIRLSHPPGPPSPAGIRGYAVSIDRGGDALPCLDAERCADAETDLRGGADDDTFTVEELAEGTFYVHAFAVSGAGMHSAIAGQAKLRVDKTDPRTRLSGLPEGWADRTVVLRASAEDDASGMADGGAFTAIAVDGEPPSVVGGDSAGAAIIGSGVHNVSFYARDAAGNVDDGRMSNGKRNAAPSRATVRIDREPPSVFFVGSAGPSDPELIEARVADPLSGPSHGRGSIAVRARGSGLGFEPLPTTSSGQTLRARWSSDDYPPGEYEFRVTGFDLAGNSSGSLRRANGTEMVLPAPLKVRTAIDFAPAGGAWDAAARDAGSRVEGTLRLASGEPAAGLAVVISERFAPGSPLGERSTMVRTDDAGGFGLALAPGPSRTVVARFDGTRRATRATSAPIDLKVRGVISIAASRRVAVVGGPPVVFRGRVMAGPGEIPPDGVSVQLQFRLPGLPWTEFRTVQSDGRGRFRYPYRFSDDDSRGARFRFRAFAPTQSDWPYEPVGSRPVAVRGA